MIKVAMRHGLAAAAIAKLAGLALVGFTGDADEAGSSVEAGESLAGLASDGA